MKRALTGVGLATVIVLAVWSGRFTFAALLILINLLGLQEFYRLLESPQAKPARFAGYLLSTCLILSCLIIVSGSGSWKWLFLDIFAAFGIFIAALYHPSTIPFQNLSITFLGLMCITLPLCFFMILPFLWQFGGYYNYRLPLGVFLLLWSNDTGAYLVGRNYGKHALFKRISPKKTWEGSAGGAGVALAMGYILSRYITLLDTLQWELLAVIVIISGTYGDLIKSMLKRSVNVKDSGTILPGHGGILDRFDSLFGSAPFVFIYLIMLWQ